MSTYINKFHIKNNQYSKEVLTCTEKPVKYKGHLIYHRIKGSNGGNEFNIVKDGVM